MSQPDQSQQTNPEPASSAPPPPPSFRLARLGRHSLIYGAGTVLRKALSFVMLPVYTRFLTPGDYGVMELIEMTLDVISIVAGAQIALGIFRYYHKATTDEERKQVVSTALILLIVGYGVVGLGSFACAPLLSRLVFRTAEYAPLVRIAALSVALQSMIVAPLAYVRVRERSHIFVTTNLAKLIIAVLGNLVFVVHYRMGVRGVLTSGLIANVIIAAALTGGMVREVGLRFSRAATRSLLRYGVPMIGTQLATFIATFGDRYFLQAASNVTAVGLYTLAYQFGFVLASLGYMPFEAVWEPARFEIAKRPDRDEYYRIWDVDGNHFDLRGGTGWQEEGDGPRIVNAVWDERAAAATLGRAPR
jgi:O-antigen/teichoic acid export membrane protein